MKMLKFFGIGLITSLVIGCAPIISRTSFPAPDDIFITTGDGDIQKPYTPVGQLIYYHAGFRLGAPLLGLIPIADIDPDFELRTGVMNKIKEMGGDALINMDINWTPPRNGILGLGASGGYIVISGTVIKR